MTYAYIRVSTEMQSSASQRFEINKWAKANHIHVDKWVIETISGTIVPEKRKLGKLLDSMDKGDYLIATEISRLGRSMLMIMSILNCCSQKNICIHTIKDNFDLSNNINSKIIAFAFALAAEIERNLISQRTKEALAEKKACGMTLGRPKGSSRKHDEFIRSQFAIQKDLAEGKSITSVAKSYGLSRNTLHRYLSEQESAH